MEAEHRHIRRLASADTAVRAGRADGVAGILDDEAAQLFGNSGNMKEFYRSARVVHRYDPGIPVIGQMFPDMLKRCVKSLVGHQAGRRIDIGEHHLRAAIGDAIGGCREGQRRHDDHVMRRQVLGQRRQVQSRRAIGADDGFFRAHGFGQVAFEAVDIGTGGQVVGAQHLDHGVDVGV